MTKPTRNLYFRATLNHIESIIGIPQGMLPWELKDSNKHCYFLKRIYGKIISDRQIYWGMEEKEDNISEFILKLI